MGDMNSSANLYDIAIIGMAGRFPGARNLDEFWRNLRDGVESVTFFTDEELEAAGISAEVFTDPNYVKAAAVIEDAELFDAPFFGFYPREAELMDPQQRIFLECAWEAMESAAYDSETYKGRVGVYAGVSMNAYLMHNLASQPQLLQSLDSLQTFVGNDRDFLSTQVSYKLNLKGPSLTVQTACSTSLVAVHLACQSLLNRECDMALAGGVSVGSPRKGGYVYQEGGILSPDGHCRAFDASAQGTIGGEGVGIIVLKRLADALADGDHIHAVIKGSAVNNDGSVKVGYTAPSVDGQAAVIAEALVMAEVDPATISYVEAHGTGTPMGDPIEVAALNQAFESVRRRSSCAIGSVKTNIGHLDAAAGIAGLIKTVLALQHRTLPPSLHFERANPQIDFEGGPFYVNGELAEWKSNGSPRRAGVSSFGIGGTNAHVILEEAPAPSGAGERKPHHLLLLSARSESALEAATARLKQRLEQEKDLDIADVAYTLQVGRARFNHRRMLVSDSAADAVAQLEALNPERVFTEAQELKGRPVIFMFPGQGAQHVNMGLELYRIEPEFRHHIDACSKLLMPHLSLDLREILYPQPHSAAAASSRLNQTSLTQPALFVIEYALARLWMTWGVEPRAMIGHSIGEYVAACLAGVFSLEDALRLVAARGRLMQQLPAGAMLVVPLPEREARPLLGEHLSLAAINSPSLCVVSGPLAAVEQLEQQLAQQSVGCSRLHTSHAFHSAMMDPALETFTEEVKRVSLKPPQIPYISNVTGAWVTQEEATDPNYWAVHLRQSVRFAEGIAELLKDADSLLLEVGPGHTLSKLVKSQMAKAAARPLVASMREPKDERSDYSTLLNAAGKLWLAGAQVDWAKVHDGERRRRLLLPTYPFERKRYWIEPQAQPGVSHKEEKAELADWFYLPVWKQSLSPELKEQAVVTSDGACWLVFLDGYGVGARLVERVKRLGQDVVSVKASEQFAKLSDGSYAVNAMKRSDYDALFKELRARKKVPKVIAHLSSLTADCLLDEGRAEDYAGENFFSLLMLTQSIGEQDFTEQIRIAVISDNLYDVTGEERLHPVKATLLGPCRVIPQEYPNIACQYIDVAVPDPENLSDRLIDQLIAEISADSPEPVVAYRRNHRWTQSFDAVRLGDEAGAPARLRPQGTYLITDALSPLGLQVAEYLARTVQARLVLLSKDDPPEREQWEQLTAMPGDNDEARLVVERLRAIEESGAELMLARCSAADRDRLRGVIAQARERFGRIHGAIHAESVQGEGLIQFKTPEMAAAVLAPKVRGTLALHALLKDEQLDFLVLCSSTSSVLGGFGLVDYSAANAFLDAFAHYNSSRLGTRTVAIDWGIWQWDDWQESLMENVPEMQAQLRGIREAFGMTLDEAVEALSRIMSRSLPQVVVSTQDFHGVIEQLKAITASSFMEQLNSIRGSEHAYSRPDLETEYVAATNEIEQTIIDTMRELFGIEGIGIHDNFFDLGGNSVVAISLISRLRKTFNQELSISLIFEAPTVADMSRIIAENQFGQGDAEELERLLSEIEGMSAEEIQEQLAGEALQSSEGRINE